MSSSRATPEGKSMTSGSDSERATERIVRYKEERRRQLAASAALQRLSSSDEEQEVGSAGGRSKLRRRREPRPPCGPAEGAADRGTPTEVRTTRASRLRAAVSGQNSGTPSGLWNQTT
ncbi:hypothetical protein FJT64_022356 [Amphibalanus amphitrite]|uniref:Uncharacterized protein n=1 Tax=Amphibalanus amphitrite TaxID=1232801 RepID=A0A6A4WU03_AMPAM|nr:hypothetical protein FJT64_022356 [Amphibalanus amphitrite]